MAHISNNCDVTFPTHSADHHTFAYGGVTMSNTIDPTVAKHERMIKTLLLILDEDKILQLISLNPDFYGMIENPTEEMTAMYESRNL